MYDVFAHVFVPFYFMFALSSASWTSNLGYLCFVFLSRADEKFSRDKTWIGSVSHDNKIRFWHAEYLFEEDSDDEEDTQEGVESTGAAATKGADGVGQAVDDEPAGTRMVAPDGSGNHVVA